MKNDANLIIGIMITLLLSGWSPALAQSSGKSSTVSESEGVTIKRNADGSMEVFDVPENAVQQQVQTSNHNRKRGSETKTAETAVKPESINLQAQQAMTDATPQADSIFAVSPVVPKKRPAKAPVHWSKGISAL